jgi:release factor glutamine methyltransferase
MSLSPTEVVTALRAAGCVFAEDEARLLTEAARSPDHLAELVARRVAGEPLEVVVGWAEFCGLRIAVDPGVFVPRRRTEFLAQHAIALTGPDAVAVDLCCGSGAVAAALAATVRPAELHAADLDPAAVRCARRNLAGLAAVHQGDLYAALPGDLRGRVDVLVANAPYVPTDAIGTMPPEARDHEPLVALDGGADGLDVLRRVLADAPEWLAPRGHVLVESSLGQAPVLAAAAAAAGLHPEVAHSEDLAATILIATRRP